MQRTPKVFFVLSLAAVACLAASSGGLKVTEGSKTINLGNIDYIDGKASGDKQYLYEGNWDDETSRKLARVKAYDEAKSITLNVNNVNINNFKSNVNEFVAADVEIDSDVKNDKTSATVKLGNLNLTNSNFDEFFGAAAWIDDEPISSSGHTISATLENAFIDKVKSDSFFILSQVANEGSGHANSTLGTAEASESEFAVFVGANAGADVNGSSIVKLENQLWVKDSKINNALYASHATADDDASASSNKVFLQGLNGTLAYFDEDIEGGIYGSYAESESTRGKATASTSYLEISNSVLGNKDANFYGSYAEGNSDSTATTTKMIISDSNLTGDVYGAFADSGKAKTGALYLLDSKIDGDVYGAEGENGATAWVAAIGSKENLANNIISGDLIGAVSDDGNAKASIFVENYTINSNLVGSQVSGNGNSNGNQIFLNDGTSIKGNVYGAKLAGSGSSTNNIITINGNVDFAPTSEIWGAYAENYNGKQDIFSGNTLNFFGSKGISVAKLGNFENYNFNLTNSKISDLTDIKNTLITTKSIENQNGKDSTINVAMSKGQFDEIRNKKIYLLNNEGGEIDAKAGRAKVGMFYRANIDLKADDNGVYSAVVGTNGKNNEGQSDLTPSSNKVPSAEEALNGITNGATGGNSVDINKDVFESPTGLTANASDINRLQPINQGRLESLMLANVNADWANKAISGLRPLSVGEITPFGIIGGGHTKYKSGSNSNIKSNDFNFVVGTGYNFDNTIAGWFFEYGRGKYDSKNNYKADSDNDALTVKGKGTNYNYGIGLFTKTFISDAYVDASLHLGKAKVNFETSSYGEGFNPNYGFNTSYFGGHVGAGYILGNGEQNSFDTSIKYLYNQVGAKDKTINEDRFQFKKELSNRLQVGEQYKFQANDMLALKAGAAFEYEFSAKAKANTVDEFTGKKYDLKAQKVKGSTYIGELGVELTPFSDKKHSSIELNAKGYGGKKEGASGNLVFKYTF